MSELSVRDGSDISDLLARRGLAGCLDRSPVVWRTCVDELDVRVPGPGRLPDPGGVHVRDVGEGVELAAGHERRPALQLSGVDDRAEAPRRGRGAGPARARAVAPARLAQVD